MVGQEEGRGIYLREGWDILWGNFNRELQKLELHFRALKSSHEAKYGEARYKM